jgi:hypothetical protein
MIEPMIAGEPLAEWERIMDVFAAACVSGWQELRGMYAERDLYDPECWLGQPHFKLDNPWLGINPDGTRVTIAQHRARQEGRG